MLSQLAFQGADTFNDGVSMMCELWCPMLEEYTKSALSSLQKVLENTSFDNFKGFLKLFENF